MNNLGVHQTHCCSIHGCKYGDEDCPVVRGVIIQDYPCEDCKEGKPYLANGGKSEPFLRFGSPLEGVDDAVMELIRLAELDYKSFLEIKEIIEVYFSAARNKG